MRDRFSGSLVPVALAPAAVAGISMSATPAPAQVPAGSGKRPWALPTPWGEPELQGIWTDESDTRLQRSPRYATQEFFTDAQRAELDQTRSAFLGRDRRSQRGTEADVAGAYNATFTPMRRTGTRTSRIVDPPNGRLPAPTPATQKSAAVEGR